MKVRVPFQYTALCVEKGLRKPRRYEFMEWAEVEIREVSGYEAPVAARWDATFPADFVRDFRAVMEWGVVPEGGVGETRWIDGEHWWPIVVARRADEPGRLLTLAEVAAKCRDGDCNGNPLMLQFYRPKGFDEGYSNPLDPEVYREVQESTREREIGQILERARSLTAVDGMLLRTGPEPVLSVDGGVETKFGGYEIPIRVVPLGRQRAGSMVYRLDRFDEALAVANVVNDADRSAQSSRAPEVFLPEAFGYDDESNAFIEASGRLLARMDGRSMSDISRAVGVAWFDLREALEAAEDVPSLEERVERILPALQAYAEVAEADDAREAERILKRWNERPISLSNGFGI